MIAAAASVTEEDDLVVIGSQAILGSVPNPPEPLLQSMEVDVYPRRSPEKADLIDGALGDGSIFHAQYGYYAHGVGPETAKAPAGWQDRLVKVTVPARPRGGKRPTAWCLEPHDLVLSKCAAGRERDWDYAREAMRAGLVEREELLARVPGLPLDDSTKEHIRRMIEGLPG